MEKTLEKDLNTFIEPLEQFLGGTTSARVGPVSAGPALKALRKKLNEVLDHAEKDNEIFHRMNMCMAEALTDWFEALNQMKAGNLDAHVSAEYGDEFLDNLGKELNETLSAMKAAQEDMEHSHERKAAAIKDWSTALEAVKAGKLETRVTARYGDEFLDRLGGQINDILTHVEADNEVFHRTNMSMADALTDWFEALSLMKAGDLDAHVSAQYGDDFLDQIGGQLNDTLSAMRATEVERERTNRRKGEALEDWFNVLKKVKEGNLDARVSGRYEDEFLDKLGDQLNDILGTFKAVDDERNRQRQQLVDQQSKLIQELSTPIIQVWDEILALPVIGIVDSVRAQDMMEKLLERVVASQARCVIIDLTGVTMIDTKTADYLIKMVKASTLVGSRCIITGIGPVVAQTITRMGLDLEGIVTLRDLRDGLKRAFQDMNIDIRDKKG